MTMEIGTTGAEPNVGAQSPKTALSGAQSKNAAVGERGAAKGQKPGKPGKKPAARKPRTRKPRKGAGKGSKPAKASAPKAKAGLRDGSKGAKVLELVSRTRGATLAEIMKATKWQKHTVRGFISGTLTKKLGLKVGSSRDGDQQRTYRVAESGRA